MVLIKNFFQEQQAMACHKLCRVLQYLTRINNSFIESTPTQFASLIALLRLSVLMFDDPGGNPSSVCLDVKNLLHLTIYFKLHQLSPFLIEPVLIACDIFVILVMRLFLELLDSHSFFNTLDVNRITHVNRMISPWCFLVNAFR